MTQHILIVKIQPKNCLDNIFIDKTCEIPSNRKYDGYQRTSASIVYKFFDKKIRSEMIVNEQLAVELHKPVIKTINRRKVYVRFKNNIWAVDLAEQGSLFSKDKNIKHLLCVINVFTEYIWVEPLKETKGKTVFNIFTGIVILH